MFATGEAVGLAEWIIDGSSLVIVQIEKRKNKIGIINDAHGQPTVPVGLILKFWDGWTDKQWEYSDYYRL